MVGADAAWLIQLAIGLVIGPQMSKEAASGGEFCLAYLALGGYRYACHEHVAVYEYSRLDSWLEG